MRLARRLRMMWRCGQTGLVVCWHILGVCLRSCLQLCLENGAVRVMDGGLLRLLCLGLLRVKLV